MERSCSNCPGLGSVSCGVFLHIRNIQGHIQKSEWYFHSLSSSIGEFFACSVRVPTVMVANNLQVGKYSTVTEAAGAIHKAGGVAGFWSGFGTMVVRDIPFAILQFPIYEGLKNWIADYQGSPCSPTQGACCGSFAGAVA